MDEAPPEPTPPPPGATTLSRQLALGAVVFAATLVVLIGLTGIVGRSPRPSATTEAAAATPSPTSSPTVAPSIVTHEPSTGGSSAPATTPSATTQPSATPGPAPSDPPTDDPVLVGAGDIAVCGSDADEETAALLDDIAGTVFTAGDDAYDDGSAADFRDCYDPTWGRHKARTWPAAGNHDWQTPDLAGYRDYFGAAAGEDGASWYAKDLGTWRVIVLDSNCAKVDGCGSDSRQGRWLADELATHPTTCTVAIFHHPRFSSGDEHGDDPAMDAFWQPLYTAGVDVIVNGHDHDYERFAPQDPDGDEDRDRGIREFVVGTGGAELRGFDPPRPNSELRSVLDHGVLALTLHPGSYEWQFHAADTDFSDRGTTRCHT
jgi:Calcineurin-like phosphoesterase